MSQTFLKNLTAKVAKPTFETKATSKLDALKRIITKGIENQLAYLDFDINEMKQPFKVMRWYKQTEDKQGYYCFLKYQNKPIPFLEGNGTAYVVETLEEVKQIYKAIKKEVKDNPEFIKHLDAKIKTMKLAKGVATKKD